MTTATPKKGFERRELTGGRIENLITRLRQVARDKGIERADNLANVLVTHRMLADETGYVELSKKMWAEIDDLLGVAPLLEINDNFGLSSIQGDLLRRLHNPEEGDFSDEQLQEIDQTIIEDYDKTQLDPLMDEAEALLEELNKLTHGADAELDSDAHPECRCGCGGRTKGGRYLPGHDAKHKGILMRRVYYGSSTDGAIRSSDAEAAWIELSIRGWAHFYDAFARNESKRERRRNQASCRICGRPLYDEESVEAGIGPVCRGHA